MGNDFMQLELADNHVVNLLSSREEQDDTVALIRSHYAVDRTGEPYQFDAKNPPKAEPGVYVKSRTNKTSSQASKRTKRKAQRTARRRNR